MKKTFIALVVLTLLGFVVLLSFSSSLLMKAADRMIPAVVNAAASRGVLLSDVEYLSIDYGFPWSVNVKGASAKVVLEQYASLKPDMLFDVSLENISVNPGDLFFQSWDVSVRQMNVSMEVSEVFANDEFSNLDLNVFSFETTLSAKTDDLRESLKEIFAEVRELYRTGRFDYEYSLLGEICFELNGVPEKIGIRSDQEEGRWLLVADREDMRDISSVLIEPLTDAELDLFSHHPIQAPLILYFTKYAADKSKAAYHANRAYPFDAYRHVLWSYLLTKRFGPEFAEKVTDAHEIGATDNTEADHEMDYNNNEIGRLYVVEGVEESEIFGLTTRDSRVIQFPKK